MPAGEKERRNPEQRDMADREGREQEREKTEGMMMRDDEEE